MKCFIIETGSKILTEKTRSQKVNKILNIYQYIKNDIYQNIETSYSE